MEETVCMGSRQLVALYILAWIEADNQSPKNGRVLPSPARVLRLGRIVWHDASKDSIQ
jgi:hypothetical protein